jgi:hypothetical protein
MEFGGGAWREPDFVLAVAMGWMGSRWVPAVGAVLEPEPGLSLDLMQRGFLGRAIKHFKLLRHHHRTGDHRQRLGLPLNRPRDRLPHARHPPPTHPPLPAPDQRQSVCLRFGVPSGRAARLARGGLTQAKGMSSTCSYGSVLAQRSCFDLRSIRRLSGCGRAGEAGLIGDLAPILVASTQKRRSPARPRLYPRAGRPPLFVGIDVHKHQQACALLDARGGEIAVLTISNSPEGYRRLLGWLGDHDGHESVVGVESPGSCGRRLVGALAAAGLVVLQVPAWRTHRERPARGRASPIPVTRWRSPMSCAATRTS